MTRLETLLSREVVVGLAIVGAIASTLASWLQKRAVVGEQRARQLNYLGYGCMGFSMVLFIVAGFRT